MEERETLLQLAVIATSFLASLVVLTVLLVQGITEGTGFGAVIGSVATLGPAVIAATRTQKRARRRRKEREEQESLRPPAVPAAPMFPAAKREDV